MMLTRAIQLETLRLFPPIMSLPKETGEQPQRLQVGNQSILIPSNTAIYINALATHTHPRYWRDPLKWIPSRWIQRISADLNPTTATESIVTPLRDTYFPWSDGPQNCPGLKFSQVEFVAVLARLLQNYRFKAVAHPDESTEQTHIRVLSVVNDCDAQMLLRMKKADQVRVQCAKME
jgi:cytochrome P450